MAIREYVLNFDDVTKVGLSLTLVAFTRISDNVNVTPPTVTELGVGFYKFSFDLDVINDSIYYVASDGGTNILTGFIELDSVSSLTDTLNRVAGLVQENQFMDNMVYDGNNNLTSARLRIYNDFSDVGTDNGVLNTYLITATYLGTELDTYACQLIG